jgi:predicted SnoaL-like aldol condensation-catalyzing enzyme
MPAGNTVSELERNKAIGRRFNEEVKNKHNLEAIDELLSPNFVNHSEIPSFAPTREGVKGFFAYYIKAFPDLTCTINDTIAEGNKSWTISPSRARIEASLWGFPPQENA